MAAVWNHLNLEQGSTRRFRFQFRYDTGTTDGDGERVTAPYDFTGATARMQVRSKYGSAVLIEVTGTSNPAGSVELQEDGYVAVWLSDEATDALVRDDGKPFRTVQWDIEVEWPSGDVTRVLQGTSTVNPNITRDVTL